MKIWQIPVVMLFAVGFLQSAIAAPAPLPFSQFLTDYQSKSQSLRSAEQELSSWENAMTRDTDLWKSRITAVPQIEFLDRGFESSAIPDISNRASSLTGAWTQSLPTGTSLELRGQKFIENQNPLFQSTDRSYSLKVEQDLIRNSFGRSQRALAQKANIDFQVAQLKFQKAQIESCEEAFELYTDTYIQQEIAKLLKTQLKDARKARSYSRGLFKDRLINKIDKLSAENDYIDTELKSMQADQKLINNKRQILAFVEPTVAGEFNLVDPRSFLPPVLSYKQSQTLDEIVAEQSLKGQELAVQRASSERWTDLKLGVEIGENFGRSRFNNDLFNFQEDYLRANLTVGFDVINNTENSELSHAIRVRNSLALQKQTIGKTQSSLIESLYENHELLKVQVKSGATQVQLLKEKMDIAFNQMKRARLNFENYLLHRNAYITQKINYFNRLKELWLNGFAIQKQYAQKSNRLCQAER